MFNSILIAYRDRPEHLKLCLEALSRCSTRKQHEIVLVDQGSTSETLDIIEPFDDRLLIDYHFIDDSGPFHKTRLLNLAYSKSVGEYVTTFDVDMLVGERFLSGIEDFFSRRIMIETSSGFVDHDVDVKMGHRVHLLKPPETEMIKGNFDLFYSAVAGNPQRYEVFEETYKGLLLGSSQFTIRGDLIGEIGGWDERFIGYGLEDIEFNLRANEWVETIIQPTDEQVEMGYRSGVSRMFHLWHTDRCWGEASVGPKNSQLLYDREILGPCVPN